jgi:outer membrane receptor protein involved in Fe transport
MEQTRWQIMYEAEIVAARRTRGARAGQRAADALTRLLDGTGLQYGYLTERTRSIHPSTSAPRRHECGQPIEESLPGGPDNGPEEIIICAPPRDRQRQREPVDTVAYDPQALRGANINGMAEIAEMTPGVEFDYFSSVGSGVYTNLAIRGVTDRHGTATGVFLDGVPIPPARSNTFARALPITFDMERVEVARGPQGALLGANTQGGAVTFTSSQPSLTSFSTLVRAVWATTEHGAPSYEAGAAAGGPLVSDQIGFRVSAWYRIDGGYVDRVDPFTRETLESNSNWMVTKSSRAALTIAPAEAVSITASLTYQATLAHDSSAFMTYLSDPAANELNNGSLLRQPFDDTFYLGSVKLTANLRGARLSTLTSYFASVADTVIDDTESVDWGGWGKPGKAFPATYGDVVTTRIALRQRAFAQLARLESVDEGRLLTWLAGVSYSTGRNREADAVAAAYIPVLGAPLAARDVTTTDEAQLAGFGQLAARVGKLELAVAFRLERHEYTSDSVAPPAFHAHDLQTFAIPKVTLSLSPAEDDLFYASAAKGYTPSGVDAALPTCFLPPLLYPTDTLWSYELGIKDRFLGERAQLAASTFHIRWNNGPLATGNCLFTHLPGAAVSNGFDLGLQVSLGKALKGSFDVSYLDARYIQSLSAGDRILVRAGEALGTPPLVTAPWSLAGSLEQTVMIGGLPVLLHAEDTFHSHNPGPFYTADPASPYYTPGLTANPAINVVNLRASLLVSGLDVTFFLENALDSQPTLLRRKKNRGDDVTDLYYATTLRPRTAGVSATWRF